MPVNVEPQRHGTTGTYACIHTVHVLHACKHTTERSGARNFRGVIGSGRQFHAADNTGNTYSNGRPRRGRGENQTISLEISSRNACVQVPTWLVGGPFRFCSFFNAKAFRDAAHVRLKSAPMALHLGFFLRRSRQSTSGGCTAVVTLLSTGHPGADPVLVETAFTDLAKRAS